MRENKIVYTEYAPAPIGPYNQAVWAGNMLFVSGQIALNPETDKPFDRKDISLETKGVLKNITVILSAAGLTLQNVAKASIFLANMDDFGAVNKAYATFFDKNPPARECVEVARLPKDVNVEISVIAVK